ncbi:MAG: DUF5317 domain-containing protein [Candidatus Dormibacteraeota bacterium]|nr:DUF5317 domain-containing protein [Candidatus Dormibacteraeota bacterium]
MLWLAALVLGLVAGFATGGRIENLGRLRFRWPWLVVVAVVIREATALTPLNRIDGIQYLYTATLAALVSWCVWNIDRLAGIWLVTAGAALNLVVIAANGGRMPVAPELAGTLVQGGHLGQYTLMTPETRLNWLADWIALPGPMAQLVREAYSPGDVIVAIGTAVVVLMAMRSSPRPDQSQARIVSDPP